MATKTPAEKHVPKKHDSFPMTDIKPYPANAKLHTPEQVNAIAASIQQFGFQQPIVVDEENVIVLGHGRFAAAYQLGMTHVPVWQVTDFTEQEKVAFRIADNKIAVETGFDPKILEAELNKLANVPFELPALLLDFDFGGPKERGEDVNDLGERLETYQNTTVKQIVLYFDQAQYDKALSRLHKICAQVGRQNNTEAVLWLLDQYENANPGT
jgi:hypothetical protein